MGKINIETSTTHDGHSHSPAGRHQVAVPANNVVVCVSVTPSVVANVCLITTVVPAPV